MDDGFDDSIQGDAMEYGYISSLSKEDINETQHEQTLMKDLALRQTPWKAGGRYYLTPYGVIQ